MRTFENKVAVVTGAGQGIGFSITEKFAKAGATVIAIGRTLSKVERTAETLKPLKVIPYGMDCGIEDEWKNLIAYIKKEFGALDILVNNAGIELSKDIKQMTYEEFKQMERCNVDSVFLGMKYCYEVLKKGADSNIVNISSVASRKTGYCCGNDGAYSATKAAVNLLSQHAAFDFAPDHIRVNAILPGGVRTAMVDEFMRTTPNAKEQLAVMNPLAPHIAEPEDIANAVLFVASEESKCMTGAEIVIDSGMLTT